MAAAAELETPAAREWHPGEAQAKAGLRREIPVPRPMALAEWVPHTPVRARGLRGLLRVLAYYFVHSARCLGHTPLLLIALWFHTRRVFGLLTLYYVLRRTNWWNAAVHRFVRFGSSNRPQFLRARREPYDLQKQYMVSHHPHGVLLCPWFNWLGREELPSATDPQDKGFSTKLKALDGLAVNLCVAPAVQFYSLHGEIYRDKVTDARSSTMRRILRGSKRKPVKESVMICPGGFSEAVYTGFSDKYEVAYLRERYGFVKVAIEEGIDIIPTYGFGSADMYWGWDWKRHERATLSQKWGLPLVIWSGLFGTNIPRFEDTVTVCFDPFPTSQYTLGEIEQCHADYCAYLKVCFDAYKGCCCATAEKELVFVGKNHRPPQSPPRKVACRSAL